MRKILLPVLAIMSILVLAACGGGGPEKAVDGFMKSYKNLEIEKAGEYFTSELEEDYKETIEDGTEDFDISEVEKLDGFKDFKANFKSLTGEMKYKITDTKIDGDNAEINVDLTYANASEPLSNSFAEIIGQMFGMAFTMDQDMTEEEANNELIEVALRVVNDNLNDYKVIKEDTAGVITLVKVDGEWLITELDENAINALAFGLIEGMEDFNPFSFDGEPVGDFEFNMEIDEDMWEEADEVN